MKTTSFGIANYCVACRSHCRHCLLSSCGKAAGVDYETGVSFANRFLDEISGYRQGISCFYYIGYSMDTPKLMDYIRFCKEHDSPGARFLQMNGFAFRNDNELASLMANIKNEGVEMIDLTFYGTEEYHDRFAGRKGDFAFVIKMLSEAHEAGLNVNISIPLLRDNLDQMEDLRRVPEISKADKFSYFLPHSKGRGRSLQDQRITKQEFESLPEEVRSSFQKIKHQTEAEWLSSGEITEPEKRSLTLVLTPENLEHYQKLNAGEIVGEIEALDERFIEQMPSVNDLAARYGRKDNRQLYRFRDLLLRWRQEYISETGGRIYDMHDETHHFSVHI